MISALQTRDQKTENSSSCSTRQETEAKLGYMMHYKRKKAKEWADHLREREEPAKGHKMFGEGRGVDDSNTQ